jgi:hypothetical protein
MNGQNFTTSFTVDQTPEEAFAAINNVRGWWSEEIEGSTDKLGDEFSFHYQDVHRSKQKITEWKGTDITFDISKKGDKTEVRFTHVGLVPEYECYDPCSNAWGSYTKGSLRSLITTGKGQQPNRKNKGMGERPLYD